MKLIKYTFLIFLFLLGCTQDETLPEIDADAGSPKANAARIATDIAVMTPMGEILYDMTSPNSPPLGGNHTDQIDSQVLPYGYINRDYDLNPEFAPQVDENNVLHFTLSTGFPPRMSQGRARELSDRTRRFHATVRIHFRHGVTGDRSYRDINLFGTRNLPRYTIPGNGILGQNIERHFDETLDLTNHINQIHDEEGPVHAEYFQMQLNHGPEYYDLSLMAWTELEDYPDNGHRRLGTSLDPLIDMAFTQLTLNEYPDEPNQRLLTIEVTPNSKSTSMTVDVKNVRLRLGFTYVGPAGYSAKRYITYALPTITGRKGVKRTLYYKVNIPGTMNHHYVSGIAGRLSLASGSAYLTRTMGLII